MYKIACATSRSVRSVAGAFTSPTSSNLSPKKSSSSSASGLVFDRFKGLLRGREEKAVFVEEDARLNVGGFVDFLMRLECAAENLKLIVYR